MRFQKYERFTLSSKTHRSNRVHTTVHDAFSTVHTKTLESDRIATNTRACLFDRSLKRVFKSMRFRYKRAQRISVDGRPKRIEAYAFSNENAVM